MARVEWSEFEDVLDLADAVETLRALMPGGLEALEPGVVHALAEDDMSRALRLANQGWSKNGPASLKDGVLYTVLLLHRHLFEEARGVLRRAMEHFEGEATLQLVQVESLALQGEDASALALLDALEHAEFSEPGRWCFMADKYLDLGEEGRAKRCYREGVDLGSQDADAAFRLARLCLEDDEGFDAASYMERSARLASNQFGLWVMSGDAWMAVEEAERAVASYRRATRIEEDDEEAWFKYGLALSQSAQWRAAIKALERATELDPFMLEGWTTLGYVQLESGYVEESLRSFRRALEEDPGDLDARLGLVAGVFESGDAGGAEALAREAVADAPEVADTHYNLGVILLELSERDQARAALARAVELEPERSQFLWTLAIASATCGEVEEAVDALKRADTLAQDQEPQAWGEVIMALARRGHLDHAHRLIGMGPTHDPAWTMFEPMVRALLALLSGDGEEEAARLGVEFERACEVSGELLPLGWNFVALEELAWRLPGGHRRRLEAMLRRLEIG